MDYIVSKLSTGRENKSRARLSDWTELRENKRIKNLQVYAWELILYIRICIS